MILKKHWPLLLTMILWLALDLGTKALALGLGSERILLIPGWLYLFLHYNRGVAFGFWFGQWPQIIVSVLIMGYLVYMGWGLAKTKEENGFLKQGLLGIIIGGALGNLSNRIVQGSVIDFIYLWPFPVFNVADIGITLGLVAFIALSLAKKTN